LTVTLQLKSTKEANKQAKEQLNSSIESYQNNGDF